MTINKIEFNKNTLYLLETSVGLRHGLKPGNNLDEGQILSDIDTDHDIEIQKIPFDGICNVDVDSEIHEGDVIASKKSIFKNQMTKSPVTGFVKEIAEDFILVEVLPTINSEKHPNVRVPFNSTVVDVFKDKILIEFKSVQINLFRSKGASFTGDLKYIPFRDLKDRSKLPSDMSRSIVITEQITPEIYPMLCSMGAGGVIANSIDRSLYNNIVILAVPIGIISGFGFTKSAGKNTEITPIIEDDSVLTKYLVKSQGKTIWLDSEYGRLIIPEEKEPYSLKNYSFDIKKLGIIQ